MVRAARDLSNHPVLVEELRPRDRRCLLGVTLVFRERLPEGDPSL